MIKRYYQSLNSLKFSFILPGLTFLIFAIAFLRDKKGKEYLNPILYGLIVVLAVVTFFYYKNKLLISKQLKDIQQLEDYRKAGMVDKSWILENRCLAYHQGIIKEIYYKDIHHFSAKEGNRGRWTFILNDSIQMSCQNPSEGRRLLAILLKENPSIEYEGLHPEGSGLISSLGGKDHVEL